MKTLIILILMIPAFAGCSYKNADDISDKAFLQYAGSTPGDSLIKSALGISNSTSIDFMKWELVLKNSDKKTFDLIINYGISQPNTIGFKPGDDTLFFTGNYEIINVNADHFSGEDIQLKNSGFKGGYLSLAKIGDQILHILTPESRLMVGNGGWSYSLNLINYDTRGKKPIHTVVPVNNIINDPTVQMIFDGRTPCTDISRELKLNSPPDCLKLKWRVTLNRDPVTLLPAHYKLERTDIRSSGEITGNWTMISVNDSTVIYQLDPDYPDKTISLLVGDENVLFFLDKDNRPFTGNKDFSYTLNRIEPV